MLLRRVKQARPDLEVRWSYFSLTQVNDKREGWTVWGAPEAEEVRGRLGFKAAEAARRQDGFEGFHTALLETFHQHKMDLEDIDTIRGAANEAGIDWDRMQSDMADPAILEGLARDHQRAVSELGVFGTPTFVVGGGAAYVRIRPAPESAEALEVFDQLARTIATRPFIREIKRPTAPKRD